MQPRVNGRFGPRPLEDRFWAKVKKTDCCWVWVGSLNPDGYGNFGVGGTTRRAHAVAWEIKHGSIEKGLQIDHLCRNRSCVNTAHLELVTHRENILRTIPYRKPRRKSSELQADGGDE